MKTIAFICEELKGVVSMRRIHARVIREHTTTTTIACPYLYFCFKYSACEVCTTHTHERVVKCRYHK